MNILDLNGNEVELSLGQYRKNHRKTSKMHKKTREILKTVFPFSTILEEVEIPGSKLRIDFFLPDYKLIVEADGIQHHQYTSHFHDDKMDFYSAKARDQKKETWATLNNFHLIRLPYNESPDEHERRLREFRKEITGI